MDLMPRKIYFDDFFDDFLSSRRDNNMKCDIYEKDDLYNIVLDVPGFSKEDISIEVDDGYLTVTASKKDEVNESDKSKNYIRRERVFGKYERSFYVGDLEEDKIRAEFKDGTLKISLPKKKEIENKKTIEIE